MGGRLMPHTVPMPVLLAIFFGILLVWRQTRAKP
jgi:hypothetical protein